MRKIPFRFNSDKFEDKYPEIKNQRFYGFKKLTMANSMFDSSYMRDIIAADLLAEAGLPVARTAYYEIIMEYGEGPVNLGLYVVIESIEDTVIERYFGDKSGNIYKPEGVGARLAEGTFGWIQHGFVKKNNEIEADWSDIEALYNLLHSEGRTSDPKAWRESLESIFDVDGFLEWLAISTIIQHWDSYGVMPNNFYLYNDPDTGLLTWISWDHDVILGIGDEMTSNASLGKNEIGPDWPLIRYLLDDPTYYSRYLDYINETINGPFDPDKLEVKCRALAELINPYVVGESSEAAFNWAVKRLIDRIHSRYEAAIDFLADERGG
jgi:spore coat protein CotH